MIELVNVSKRFKKYVVPFNSLKSFLLNYKKYREENKKIEELIAVKNLSMKIHAGEILCIVGRNGAGKSTLAKMIAGTIAPTEGQIKVNGRVVPFLELGVAFNSELSGYDNAILNGVLLGMKKKYIKEKINEIFAFAEVQDFIDTPLKFYSSGMLMRLAFSIGMFANGDVYIFDEPTSNLDTLNESTILNLIKENCKGMVFLISHRMSTVSFSDVVYRVENGKCFKI